MSGQAETTETPETSFARNQFRPKQNRNLFRSPRSCMGYLSQGAQLGNISKFLPKWRLYFQVKGGHRNHFSVRFSETTEISFGRNHQNQFWSKLITNQFRSPRSCIITSLNSQWFQKYKSSKLKLRKKVRLSMEIEDFFIFFNFNSYFIWNHWEFRDMMYLILKV